MLVFIKADVRLEFGLFIFTVIADFSIFVFKNNLILVIFKRFIRTLSRSPARG